MAPRRGSGLVSSLHEHRLGAQVRLVAVAAVAGNDDHIGHCFGLESQALFLGVNGV